MTQQELRVLVDYHYWARDRMLAAVEPLSLDEFTRDLGSSFRSVRDTLSHLHGAEWIWLSRFQGTSPDSLLPHERFPTSQPSVPRGRKPKFACARWWAAWMRRASCG